MNYQSNVSNKIPLSSLSFRAKLNAARNLCESGISHSTNAPFEMTKSGFYMNSRLSMGEGNTPLVRLFNLEKKLYWQGELWAKCEYQNPTGSFKDRGSVAEISAAIKQNKRGVVCASTGNMAASLAAYATRAGLNCNVVVPVQTPESKLRQALICGANLTRVAGNYDECVTRAAEIAKTNNFLLCGDYETRRIGQRSIGVELAKSEINFSAFIVPVGNGTLGCAIAEGFASRNEYPEFWGVQGMGADPLFQAWKNSTKIKSVINPQTIASAMNVGNPLDGDLTMEWVRKTNGRLMVVTDAEILAAQKLLAKTEGIYVESAAASTIAGLIKVSSHPAKPNSNNKVVALILTGIGMKESTLLPAFAKASAGEGGEIL